MTEFLVGMDVAFGKLFWPTSAVCCGPPSEMTVLGPGVGIPTPLQRLNAEMLDAIANQDVPDTVKVFNLGKAIGQRAAVNPRREPYLVSIGDKAEQIAQAFETRQETTAQTLKSLLEILAQAKKARQERDATRLSPEAFAVYWLLKHDGVEQADTVARQAEQAFEA